MNRCWPTLLPELQRFARTDQDAALSRARRTPLDAIELVGMAIGLAVVTALTKVAAPEATAATRLALTLLNFAIAAPLLVLVLGPIHLRRLRRGLRQQLDRQDAT